MAVQFKLVPIFDDFTQEINIFFHGYTAVSTIKKYRKLVANILQAKPRGRVYLLVWGSGAIFRKRYLAHRAGYLIMRGVRLGGAEALPLEALFQVGKFKFHENKSEKIGMRLKKHLGSVPHAREYPVNFIGHSLGARIIYTALSYYDWSTYNIQDCIMLGGAADLNVNNWDKCLEEISGKIYNAYSTNDNILSLAPDFRKRIGQGVIPYKHSRILNRNYHSFGHNDYWRQLHYLLPRFWENYIPTEQI